MGAESIPIRHFEIAGFDEDVFGMLANLNELFGEAAPPRIDANSPATRLVRAQTRWSAEHGEPPN